MVIAVAALTPLAWLVAFAVGWVVGPVVPLRSEEHWAEASAEFSSDLRREGLWAREFARAKGDESKAKAAYIRQRALEIACEASHQAVKPTSK